MRKIMKRAFAAVIVAVMLLTSMPMSGFSDFNWEGLLGVKASAANVIKSDLPEDFDLDAYALQIIREESKANNRYGTQEDFDNLKYYLYYVFSWENKVGSLAKVMYNCFANDKTYVTSAEAWEAIKKTANPSNNIDDLNLQQQYEAVLYSWLFDTMGCGKTAELAYSSSVSETTGFVDSMLSNSVTAEILSKTDLDSTASKEAKDAAIAFIKNNKTQKWAALSDFTKELNKIAGAVDKLYSAATSVVNYTQKIGMYCTLMDIGADFISVLREMKSNTNDFVLKSAIQAVIDTITQGWYGVVEKTVLDAGSYVETKALKSLISYAYEGCCAICPFLQGMVIGDKIGTAVCNLLFATEDNIKQYETLKIIVQIEDALTATFNKYMNNISTVNASKFWAAIDLSAVLYETGKDAAVEMAYICQTKGLVNIISNAFGGNGKNSVEQYETTAERINSTVQDYYNSLRNCWRKFIYKDYPQFNKLLTEVKTGSVPITSISVSEKDVYCRVGEYPILPQIIKNPTDTTESIGYKSDNEEIFKSGERFSLSILEKAQKTGTANVTVYSLNNPEICDSFTFHVVGEDETIQDSGIAESGKCGRNVYWSLTKSGTLIIHGNGYMERSEDYIRKNIKRVIIYNGVTSIDSGAFVNCTTLKSVTIPDSVTVIGSNAFHGCTGLTSIIIPDSVKSINFEAFNRCTGLTSVTIGKGVTNIGDSAFVFCTGLKRVNIKNIVGWSQISFSSRYSNPLYYSPKLFVNDKLTTDLIIPNGVKCIGSYSFNGCTTLKSVTIPNSVTSIGKSAFRNCSGLTNVTIPDGVTNIDDLVFYGCSGLTNVTIPDNVTRIGDYAFSGCGGLTNVTIPDGVTNIGDYVFYGCSGLTNVKIPDNVTSIGDYAFSGCSGLTNVKIPDNVTSIGDYAFSGCSGLTNVKIPDNVTSIGDYAFNCIGLTSITVNDNNKVYNSRDNCNAIIYTNTNTLLFGCKNTVIPDTVTSIGDYAFYGCTDLKSITIPDSVTSIGVYAFSGCTGLISVKIGNGVTTLSGFYFGNNKNLRNIVIGNSVKGISNYEFEGCTGLTNVTIPDSVTDIGSRAFRGCTGLTKVNITDIAAWCNVSFKDWDSNPLYYAHNLYLNDKLVTDLIIPDGITSIGERAFYNCSSLTSITIPDSVTSIGVSAFNGCSGLTSITIPDSVTSIGDSAFYGCTGLTGVIIGNGVTTLSGFSFENNKNLKNIVIGDSVTKIGSYEFASCTGLTSITIPNSVKSIGHHAFWNCTGLTSITIPDGVTNIGDYVFCCCSGLTNVKIPDNVTSIGNYAFSGCSGLTSVTIPDSVTSIGGYAFDDCTGLTKVNITDIAAWCNVSFKDWDSNPLYYAHNLYLNDKLVTDLIIPDGVTNIGVRAFYNCSGLISVTIPDSVMSIGNFAFYGCSGLTSVTVGNGVTSLSGFSFENNKNLKNIVIGNSVTSIDSDTFYGCSGLTSIIIPDSVTSINRTAFGNCTGLTSITIPDSVTTIDSSAFSGCTGLTYVNTGNGVTTLSGFSNKNLKSIVIGNNVTEIGCYTFKGCTGLTSVTIGNGVTKIRDSAFEGCTSLTSIAIPDSVTRIYDDAFRGCTGLTSVTIGNSVTSIGDYAFSGCTNLTNVTIPDSVTSIGRAFNGCTGLTSITIPDSVTSIGDSAFSGCTDLMSIIIPDSVTGIYYEAFKGCIKLKDVYYTGSEDEWKSIKIENRNDYLKNATIHYNYKKCEHSLKHEKSPATCTSDGAEYDICSKCGAKLNVKVIAASGHKWGEWITVTPATVTASGTEKHICSVCKEEETRTVAKLTGLHDDKSGVELIYNNEFGAGTQLKVEQQFSGKSFQIINTEFGNVNSKIYDIATYKDGVKVQPNGEITVRIPLPAGYSNRVFVCYVDSVNGKVTKIPCEVKDGYVIFKTNHFSEYAIVEQPANVKSVSVSDITLNYKKSATIKPTIKADEGAKYTVKYSSSNTKVATVDENGKVYAAKRGSATITCTVTDSNGNTVQDTCKVTVKYSFGQWLIKILLFGWIWY